MARSAKDRFGESQSELRETSPELEKILTHAFPLAAATSAEIHRPMLAKKGVLKVVDVGADFGELVTSLDLKASEALLHGIKDRYPGLAELLPGSFSEETDSPERTKSLNIWEVDSMDGSGDALKTGLSPTVLVSRLSRESTDKPFEVIGGLILDVQGGFAIVSDRQEMRLGVQGDHGEFRQIRTRRLYPDPNQGAVAIPRREAYPQHLAHEDFPEFLANYLKREVKQIPAGGAGRQALQFLRGYLEPTNARDCPNFYNLPSINVLLNCQPDWKTWDTDPLRVALQSLGLPAPQNIYGESLQANASANSMKQMHHSEGVLVAADQKQLELIAEAVKEFEKIHGKKSLLNKDY